ncbi:carbohydrate ABC transporter permease [Faecalicatena orotica]|uniref:Carbohydrate ABC transporter membrane protein 2 (CUT1 family) n=1 Tax=Faecalicatena orotica TaxID=1544 RepID=A0A2Y9BJN7_9FIRM|nr:carbohydrate ABC transporter permease [Faecalicatena orotica]PWJ28063.1 carbohydrate ABC transporter membrane protein 2 (CUT1 family) [Faecalicatena orotica]SSA57088.1 carbohydrate ABC transporter membrane protein 2, CUT1 family [Faecalicatena orotica]
MNKKLPVYQRVIIYGVLILICLICIIPIITVISISFSTDMAIIKDGYGILPKGFTLEAYKYVLKDMESILRSYGISIFVTVTGCVLGLSFNAMIAYVLSRKDYKYKKQLTVFLIIPMVLNGGLVPTYIWITKYLHLKNTIWVMILPMLIVPWFIILLRTFFSQIPSSLIEAATVDGASELTIFVKIVLPLAKPALATVGMFITLNYWNDWFQPLMYIDNSELYNLQYRLYILMRDVQEMIKNSSISGMGISIADLPTESMRMAMCVIAAGPMLVIFPFFQKYFVKGLTVGGVKG